MFNKYWKILVITFITALSAGCSDKSEDAASINLEIRSLLDLADVYRRQGQFRASLIEAQNALQLDTNNIETREFVAQVFRDLGDSNSSIEALNIALSIEPNNIDLNLALSESYLQARRFEDGYALVTSIDVGSEEQQNTKDWLIGNFEAADGNTTEARESFLTVLGRDPDNLETLLSLARLEYIDGNVQRSQELTDLATSADTTSENVDVWIWRGQLAALEEDWATSEEAFFEALDIMSLYDTMTSKRFNALQSILVPLRNQQKNAEALRYSEIIENSPQGQLLSSFSNALSLFQEGNITQAENALNSSLELAPDHPGSNILLGLARYEQGEYQEAERLLREFVDIDTTSAAIVSRIADTYLRLNDLDGALEVLEQRLESTPDDTAVLAMAAIILQSMGELDQANIYLQHATEIDPDTPQLLYTLGVFDAQLGDMESAIENLSRAVSIDPEFLNAKSALLEIYTRVEMLDTALALVSDWLENDPNSVFNNMAAGILETRRENLNAARAYFSRALQLDNGSISARLNLARIELLQENYFGAEERYDQVLTIAPLNNNALSGLLALGDLSNTQDEKIARVERIISQNPNQIIPIIILGQYFLLNGDINRAAGLADSAFEIENNDISRNFLSTVTVRQALLAFQNNNYSRALDLTNQALDINPNNTDALSLATNIEAKEGNFIRAQELINQLKELQPRQASVLELEGDVIFSTNDPVGAQQSYLASWILQPSSELGLKIYQVYGILEDDNGLENFLIEWTQVFPEETTPSLLLAMKLQDTGREEEALKTYENLYLLNEENVVVLNNMAWIYKDSDPQRALELAARAAELYPENPNVLDTYGWILYQQNQRQAAIETLERAAELDPDSDEIQEHLNTARL